MSDHSKSIAECPAAAYRRGRQSIPFARFLFAITAAQNHIGRQVVIDGWFRRNVRPYVEMSRLTCDGRTHRTFSRWVQLAIAAAATAIGAMWYSGL